MNFEMWCSGCQKVKGVDEGGMLYHMTGGKLGCCPKCETQLIWRKQ